jgi:hypothetical protein
MINVCVHWVVNLQSRWWSCSEFGVVVLVNSIKLGISYSNFRFGLRMPVNLLTVPGVIGSGICLGSSQCLFTFGLKVNKL